MFHERDKSRRNRYCAGRNKLISLTQEDALELRVVESPERSCLGTEQILNLLQTGSLASPRIEGVLPCDLINNAADIFRTCASGGAQHSLRSNDRLLHELLHLRVDSALGIDAEALRDLRDGGMSGGGCLRALAQQSGIRLWCARHGRDYRLQLGQCAHVCLISRPDKFFLSRLPCQCLYGIEDVANGRSLYCGVLLRHPEES